MANNYRVRPQGYKTNEIAELLGLQGYEEKHTEYILANHINKFVTYFCNSDKQKVQDLNYLDVVTDVKAFLSARLQASILEGVRANRIVFDPGFGFGKTRAHNISLIKHLDQFAPLGQPILVGLSRKSILGQMTGNDVAARVYASIAAAVIAAQKGAKILRVHDVKATVEALKIVSAIQ